MSPPDTDTRVAVVGAGMAGLCAALALADRGVAATVYDRADRVGGRVHTGPDGYWDDGQTTEWCGELIDSDHLLLHSLAAAFRLELTDMLAAQPEDADETYYFLGAHYGRDQAVTDSIPVRLAAERDRAAFESGSAPELAFLSAYDWIESRVPGGHDSAMGRLIHVAYTGEYAAEMTDLAAMSLAYDIADQPDPNGFSVLGSSDERFHVEGGNQRLARSIAAALPGPVELGWRLDAIRADVQGRVALTFRVEGSPREVAVDHVILALPFTSLRSVDYREAGFDEPKRAAIETLGAGRNAKLALQFGERYWNSPGPWGTGNGTSYSDTGYMCTWEPTRGQPGESGILVNYTGGDAAGALAAGMPYATADDDPAVERHAREFLASLEPVFPGIGARWNGKAALSNPMLDPALRLSYAYNRLGFHGTGVEPVRCGNVHFAGEHCASRGFAGFMEGAARDGQRAAEEVLDDLGA